MQKIGGILQFNPIAQVNTLTEFITDPRYVPAQQSLLFIGFYRLGELTTDRGSTVTAIKYIDNSMDILLVQPIPGTQEARRIIDRHPHTIVLDYLGMPHSEIIPEYNCHGYCFGDSFYRIPDVTQILSDEFEECPRGEASCVVYYEGSVTVHSALIENGQYLSKGGIRGLHRFNSVEEAIAADIHYDRYIFYRRR